MKKGTTILKDVRCYGVDLVGTPAIGKRFLVVKSAEADPKGVVPGPQAAVPDTKPASETAGETVPVSGESKPVPASETAKTLVASLQGGSLSENEAREVRSILAGALGGASSNATTTTVTPDAGENGATTSVPASQTTAASPEPEPDAEEVRAFYKAQLSAALTAQSG